MADNEPVIPSGGLPAWRDTSVWNENVRLVRAGIPVASMREAPRVALRALDALDTQHRLALDALAAKADTVEELEAENTILREERHSLVVAHDATMNKLEQAEKERDEAVRHLGDALTVLGTLQSNGVPGDRLMDDAHSFLRGRVLAALTSTSPEPGTT